jgi:hypothetical protein
MKITDDIRILAALRDGGSARNYYKSGYGWSNPPSYYCSVDGRDDDKRYRLVSLSSIDRCVDGGLIEVDWDLSKEDRAFGDRDFRYKLTEAGTAAAAALGITLDQALAPPKPRAPKPEMSDEEKEAAKHVRYARSTLKYLAKGGRLVRADGRWLCRHMDLPYEPPGRGSWYMSEDRNLPLIRHLVEDFVGCDGLPSLRITPAGADVIAKRKPLNITASSDSRLTRCSFRDVTRGVAGSAITRDAIAPDAAGGSQGNLP